MSAPQHRHWTGDVAALLRADRGFRLARVDPASTPGHGRRRRDCTAELVRGADGLDQLQSRLHAAAATGGDAPSVLLVLQGMDTSGKGGIVRHVVGAMNPQGVHTVAFGAPTPDELAHDFLWRIRPHVPRPGTISVFDRSHYEDVLIGRVRTLADAAEIDRRYTAITAFERELTDAGTRVLKVMLHISNGEQRDRLMDRLERSDKQWKYTPADTDDRMLWPAYMDAYQAMLDHTSTPDAPWYVIPADHKWYARLAVQALLLNTLHDITPDWPAPDYDVEAEKDRLRTT